MLRGLICSIGGTPSRLIGATWLGAVGSYAFGPLTYAQAPRFETWFFVLSCVTVFSLGAVLAQTTLTPRRSDPSDRVSSITPARIQRVIALTALAGLLGIGFIAVDKLYFSGLDYSQGVTALRFERAAAVGDGTALELRRTPLLYLGYVLFGFGVSAFVLYVVRGDGVSGRVAVLAHLALLSPVGYSLLYGGRSPIGLVLLCTIGAILVRVVSGQPRLLPHGRLAIMTMMLLMVAFVAYTGYVFAERRAYTGLTSFDVVEDHFATGYEARIDPAVSGAIRSGQVDEQIAIDLLLTYYYLTHEIPMLDRTLGYEGELGPYYGQYQFYIATALLSRVVPGFSAEQDLTSDLRDANVYGWFSTAWGGMYLDFGVVGGLIATLLCGWLAGLAFESGFAGASVSAQLLASYAVAGILASPFLSIFTISISGPILASFVITGWLAASPSETLGSESEVLAKPLGA